ncbi:hypothetical protein [Streptomyces sp. CoH17]|uniref:hypothetical protein n=1 Tax=Streptomyces sp. CoH17 TaxID=2992806 RepID=UPI00227174F8|nr:hypothetical protein [Streptomyces sp. CoH17]
MNEGKERVINEVTFAETMMRKGFDNLTEEGTVVSPMQGLAAARQYHSFMKDVGESERAEKLLQQLDRIIKTVREVVSPEQMELIVSRLDGSDEEDEQEVLDVDVDEDEEDVFTPEFEKDERDTLEVE